jgi:hypothetical protein
VEAAEDDGGQDMQGGYGAAEFAVFERAVGAADLIGDDVVARGELLRHRARGFQVLHGRVEAETGDLGRGEQGAERVREAFVLAVEQDSDAHGGAPCRVFTSCGPARRR